MDDDSNIGHKFDDIVEAGDNMILSEEGPNGLGPCYEPNFRLSDEFLLQHYSSNASAAKYFASITTDAAGVRHLNFFHGNTLINWAIFTKPRHPFLLRTLENIVEIIKHEYTHKSVLNIRRHDHRWKVLTCSTGFAFTYTLREMLVENALGPDDLPRIEVRDFARYDGKCRFYAVRAGPEHYTKIMRGPNAPHFLREYEHVSVNTLIENLQGKLVAEGRAIYLVEGHTRRPFPDYDTFLKMGFDDSQVKHASDEVMTALKLGPELPSLMVK